MNIIDALKTLNPLNEDEWTTDGVPRLDILKQLTGDQTLDRNKVNKAAPGFTKDNPIVDEVINHVPGKDKDTDEEPDTSVKIQSNCEYPDTIDGCHSKLRMLSAAQTEVKAEILKTQHRLEKLSDQYAIEHPPMTATEQIKAYQNSQKKASAKRASDIQELGKKGINIPAIKKLLES